MKKIMSLCLMLMCQLALMGQARLGADPDYNPSNPEDPNQSNTRYILKQKVYPERAGSIWNGTEFILTEGESVWLEVYNNEKYRFVSWNQGDTVVSNSQSFYYTMPAKNVTLTAVFRYDPESPADPEPMPLSHTLTLEPQPRQGGSFNMSKERVSEGVGVWLHAYPNPNQHYQFKGWKMGDSILSYSQELYYTMSNDDAHIVGIFEYNPANPGNPGSNLWNPTTGEIIVDDFTPGRLSSAIYNTLDKNGSSWNEVAMITVAGKMKESDFSVANDFSNCTLLDLSRSYGYTRIPDWAFDWNGSLQHIILPAEVEHIGYCAFYGCNNLTEITCYAITPPTVDNEAFVGIAEGAVLHVLAAAIPFYTEAEGWKDYFTIVPLTEEVRTLEINLPAGSEDGRYKNMTLELVNVENGRKQKYVISDRVSYTFSGLLKESVFNVYVRNSLGYIIGQIDNVEIEDEDVSVTFESLLQPQDVTLSVLTAEGEDVTNQVQATWFETASNTYLSRGNAIKGVTEGTQLTLRVALPQALGMAYVVPEDLAYTVKSSNNSVVVTLNALPQVTISGTVKDITTGGAIAKAVVSVSQTLNGKYSKAFTTKTDNKGAYSLTVYNAPSTLTYSSAEYITQTASFDDFTASTELGTISLKAITGATITTSFTYRTSVEEGAAADIQNWYSDYANVAYSIYNKTQQKSINDFSVQYPSIVLLEEVAEGDELLLTATSKNGAFVAVEATAVIDAANRAEATFDIVALGGIKASFTSTDNAAVVGILYNTNGQLMKQYNYTTASITINELQDGNYTMVSMGSSRLFNSIYNLSQLPSTGLKEGVDYVQNSVVVKSGCITVINNDLIPTLDESKLYYTGGNTMFNVNKTSVTAGNYLTLKGKIDFKDVYAAKVNNVSMVIDLPESAEFVENSVMVGTGIASYMLDGNRLTIPLERYTDQVRFCIIPTAGGDYAPNAFAQFTVEGKEVLQPIGSAHYTIKDLSISVPTTVAKTTIPVSGTALGNSTIQIYDNGVLIGETTSLANGAWSTTCELDEPYNLSKHSIYAKVTNKQGLELISETKDLVYDANAIEVSTVTMINISHRVGSYYEEKTVFDFQNPAKSIPAYWYWPDYPEFTFLIDFTNNDTTKVSNVVLWVETCKGNQVPLQAKYDANKGLWIASGKFGDWSNYDIPVNVSLDFNYNSEKLFDSSELSDISNEIAGLSDHFFILSELLEKEMQKDSDINIDNINVIDTLDWASILDSAIIEMVGFDEDIESSLSYSYFDNLSDEELDSYILQLESIDYELEQTRTEEALNSILLMMSDSIVGDIVLEDGTMISLKSCIGIIPDLLLQRGFQEISSTGGRGLYLLTTETFSELVDFDNNRYTVIKYGKQLSSIQRAIVRNKSGLESGLDAFNEIMDNINSLYQPIASAWEKTNKDLLDFAKKFEEDYIKQSFDYGRKKSIYNSKLAKLNRLKTELKALNSLSLEYHIKLGEIQNFQIEVKQAKSLMNAAGRLKAITGAAFKAVKPLPGIFAKNLPLTKYADAIYTFLSIARKYQQMYRTIPYPCKDDEAAAKALREYCIDEAVAVEVVAGMKLGTTALLDFVTFSSIASSAGTAGVSVPVAIGAAITNIIVNITIDNAFNAQVDKSINYIKNKRNELECIKKCGTNGYPQCPEDGGSDGGNDGDTGDGNGNGNGGANKSNNPPVEGIHDPSGYVYEGVSSNRVEGVMASCYYKETVEDMYGDLHENEVFWDAEQYAQENPLFTDANGMYRWDVPQGLWRVKFEKEGYETTYSEWLPVPPPQLEVNVAIKQNTQPEVKTARAYEDAIEVEFSKYMQPDLLNTENIIVTKNGETAAGEVKLLNEEEAYEGKAEKYASKLRFIPEVSFLATDDVVLTISHKVKSYAGIQMEADYTQEFDIEKEVKSLEVAELIEVPYTGSKQIVISALPYDAAIGKTVIVKSSSTMIASVSAETVVMDENGQATVRLRGELPGTSVITFEMVDADVSGMSTVQVAVSETQITADPTASRVSGTAVYRNTAITLNCDTKGAVIYYTLDGSCPCDEGTRLVYDGHPIIVGDNMTLKVMAVAEGMFESDVIEYNYTIKETTLAMNLKEGWNWVSHNVETAIAATELQENATRIVSQTEELINDPVYGFVGSLESLRPSESYKVKVSKDTKHTLKGYEYNAATPISVYKGWNWIGYPANQVMSVNEAFANIVPSEGDYIVGQEGFALYTEDKWSGTLLTLNPGSGYMYHAQQEGELSYNTAIVSKAKALYGRGLVNKTPWTADKHKYPKVMCLIADLYDAGALTEDYYVGAFCGTECRGVGKYVEGKLMMNIYGEGNEEITFIAMHCDSEVTFEIIEKLTFEEILLGNMTQAYPLHIGKETSVLNVKSDLKVRMEGGMLYLSLNGKSFDRVTLTDLYGDVLLIEDNVATDEALNCIALPDGVYIVTIAQDGVMYYHKVLKACK